MLSSLFQLHFLFLAPAGPLEQGPGFPCYINVLKKDWNYILKRNFILAKLLKFVNMYGHVISIYSRPIYGGVQFDFMSNIDNHSVYVLVCVFRECSCYVR